MIVIGEPLGQAEPLLRSILGQRRQHLGYVRKNLFILDRRGVMAAAQHVGFARLGQVAHRHHGDDAVIIVVNRFLGSLNFFVELLGQGPD